MAMDGAQRQIIKSLLSSHDQRSAKQSKKYGKSLRKAISRDTFAAWQPPMGRPAANDLLFGQDKAYSKALVSVRHDRMAESAFSFFRGSALVMASDLSSLPTTGIEVQTCGNAHVLNFGVFRTDCGRMVFDIRDYDETCRGPWEWDVARLAASIEILGRDRGFEEEQRSKAVLLAIRAYREAMREFASMGNTSMWHARIDAQKIAKDIAPKDAANKRARSKKGRKAKANASSLGLRRMYTHTDGKRLEAVSEPPYVVPLRDLVEDKAVAKSEDMDMAKVVSQVLRKYRSTVSLDQARLLDMYSGVDIARKVVGVGGVGLRAWLVVLQGTSATDSLVLQVREATDSVMERFVGKAPQKNHGQRVAEGQRAMQAADDLLLGWTRIKQPSGGTRDYYVRQLWDRQVPIDQESIRPKELARLARACGWTLAHAHARTGDRFAIASYLGGTDVFDQAVLSFAQLYAWQNQRDYEMFLGALGGVV